MAGVFYNANNVAVGIAALYLQPYVIGQTAVMPTDHTPFQAAPGGTSEVQTVTITGTPTGGTFTLSYNGNPTAAIAYNATAAVVQTALRLVSGLSSVLVTGGPGPGTAWVVTFPAFLGNVNTLVAAGSLTGGTTPTIAVTVTTAGVSGWFSPGGTDQGYSLTPNANSNEITMEEQAASVQTTISSKSYQITGALAESTPVNRALYYGATISAEAVTGNTVITMSDDPQFYAGFFEYRDAALKTVRLFIPRGTVIGTGDVAFRRAADKRMYGIQFTSACNTTDIVETTYDLVA